MSILDEIVTHKKTVIDRARELYPIKLLEESPHYTTPCVSLVEYLRRPDRIGIIAEIKRMSPSKGVFHESISVENLSIGYMQGGASALSVLTDKKYFGGVNEDLRIARRFNFCPILRKDFVVDPYQIHEARAIGADVVLLIAAILTPDQMEAYANLAHSLGMQVLMEVHSAEELSTVPIELMDLIGVNNRDLNTFSVSLETSLQLADALPGSVVKVSESGISSPAAIMQLRQAGYEGFLIGETFMAAADPAQACARFVRAVQALEAGEAK